MLRQLDESDGKGYKTLMHYLQSMEITINFRKVPQTEALKDQMLLNLEPVPTLILKILAEGAVGEQEWFKGARLPKESLYELFKRVHKDNQFIDDSHFALHFKKIFPGIEDEYGQFQDLSYRQRPMRA